MKVIRVPWIQCRADEAGTECYAWEWRGKDFEIMAFSRKEAEEWWTSLSEPFKSQLLGLRERGESDGALMLF
jgi:hypothetical protein